MIANARRKELKECKKREGKKLQQEREREREREREKWEVGQDIDTSPASSSEEVSSSESTTSSTLGRSVAAAI